MNVIGIDMDGVVISNDQNWANYYNSNFDLHNHTLRPDGNPPATWSYFIEVCPKCFDHCVKSTDVLSRSVLVPGAKEGLEELSQRYKLVLISHRHGEIREEAIRLLNRLDVAQYFDEFDWSFEDKETTCRKHGAKLLLDDGPANVEKLMDTEIVPILFSYPYNEYLTDAIRVHNWPEAVETINSIVSKDLQNAG